jgi:glycosyltransferase involved in cell wall biosynthesis
MTVATPDLRARPLISVVMPCYNAAPYVEEAIASVLYQSHGEVEIVVVDDGSTDGSAAIVAGLSQAHPDRVRLFHTQRAGPYPARNLGLRHVRGEFIAFLDADDYWRPDALAKLHAALVEHGADIAYCGWQNVGEGLQAEPHVPPAYEDEDTVDHFVRTCPWPIHGALLRGTLVQRLGGFSERRFASMDYDFWLRALALTRRIKRVPDVLAFYRWHQRGQVSAVKWRQVLDALDAQQAFIRDNPQLVAHLSPARLQDLTEGQVLRQAYRAFWKRDLTSAQRLFRHAASKGSYRMRDLRHIVSALLPLPLYRRVVALTDREAA